MEIKKSPKANLENKKTTSYLLGYIFILASIFVAFEWTETEVTVNVIAQGQTEAFEEEVIPFTLQNPPPPPPPQPVVQDIIKLVEEDIEIEEVEIQETEADEETKVEVQQYDPNAEYGDADAEVVDDSPIPFAIIEKEPQFPGGNNKVTEWFMKEFKTPKKTKNRGKRVRMQLTFIISKEGKVVNPEVVRSTDDDASEEALRVLGKMPNWQPGQQRGKSVNVQFALPITINME